jgi:hypothetical protein
LVETLWKLSILQKYKCLVDHHEKQERF